MSTYRQDTDTKSFFTKVNTPFGAIAMVRVTSKAFFMVGTLQFLMALFSWSTTRSPAVFFDCTINLVCAAFIFRFHSRVASLLALTLSITSLILTLTIGTGGAGIILSLLALWAGARALEVTMKLHGGLASPPKKTLTKRSVAIGSLVVMILISSIYAIVTLSPVIPP